MRYYDYEWDLNPQSIIFDRELDIENLGWQAGDYFKLIVVNGVTKLVKLDPLEKFLEDGTRNE
jgi:hypothetical protein